MRSSGRRRAAFAVLLGLGPMALGACGRVGYQRLASIDDGGSRDAGSDAGLDGSVPRTCDWLAGPPVFGAPVALSALHGTADDRDPVLQHGGLELLFISNRNGSFDIFRATRPDASSPFGTPVPDPAVNSGSSESHYYETADRLEAVFTSDRPSSGPGTYNVFSGTRASAGLVFPGFDVVPNVNGTGNGNFDPLIAPDLLTLWLSPYQGGATQQDLVFATRPDRSSPFGSPVAATELNSTANDADPSFVGDGRVIVFSSARSGINRAYYAIRAGTSGPFGAPIPVPGIDPAIVVDDPAVSEDGCSLYFATTSLGGPGQHDLYVLEAP
ncbi:MAG: hypothetical protein U0230_22155 [Polyangiales bacterium]